MSLIDRTYFILDANIPYSDYENLDVYITRYEKDVLIKLLGRELYDLVAAYDANTSPQRIKDLVEGKLYAAGDIKVKWEGLINNEKRSLIAYYVYAQYIRNHAVYLSADGVQLVEMENAKPVPASQLASDAWANMLDLYGYYDQIYNAPSAYNYLVHHYNDYPEWDFTPIGSLNNWDL